MSEAKTRQGKKNSGNKRSFKRIKKTILTLMLVVIVGGGLAFGAVIAICVRDLPPFDPDQLQFVEASFVYDNQGREITALHDEQNRVIVSIDEIPEHVQKAFIAIEDERFEKHFGVDMIGFFRALLTNIRYRSIRQGFSTITQQLARNAFLTFDQTYERKIKEVWLALLIEKHFTKPEILEMYLNRIYFGNHAYGVETAAQTYFGKTTAELTVAEGALLAGIISSPNVNNPFFSEEIAVSKQTLVLNNMLRLKFIDQQQYDQALAEELEYGEPPTVEYPHPYFIDYVIHQELVDILTGIPQFGSEDEAYNAIYNGGLRIYTTMDSSFQAQVENVLNRSDLYPRTVYVDMAKVRDAVQALSPNPEISLSASKLSECIDEENGVPQPQAAVVLVNPKTGEITALGGGREYSRKNNQLLRFTSLRQPGSAIKPIVNYGPAFEEGILAGAGSVLDDSPYISGSWAPENFDFRFRGLITVREALLYSFNVPAVRSFEKLTPQVGTRYAEEMGISTFAPGDEQYLPTTLGGITNGVSALDMAQAYCVLANEGLKLELHAIERIENSRGQVIYEHKPRPRQILSPASTFIVTDILQDQVRYYTGSKLNIDRPIACKTGTTNFWRDVYLAAYTPNLVATFWMGYDEPRVGNVEQGWSYSTTFLREIFKEVFKTLPIENFRCPPGVTQVEVCTKSGLLPTDLCRAQGTVATDYFLENQVPHLTCDLHMAVDIDTSTGLPAGPFVPPYLIETKIFLNRPPYLITDSRWEGASGRRPEDAAQMPPFGEQGIEPGTERPMSPTGFTANVRGNQVALEWGYPGEYDLKRFILFREKNGEERQLIAYIRPEFQYYTDVLEDSPGTEYSYILYAADLLDRFSLPVELRVVAGGGESVPRPPKPLEFKGVFGDDAVVLTWIFPGEAPDGFILERKKHPDNYMELGTLPGNQLTYRDEDLEPGSTYYYRLYTLKNGVASLSVDYSVFVPYREGEFEQPDHH